MNSCPVTTMKKSSDFWGRKHCEQLKKKSQYYVHNDWWHSYCKLYIAAVLWQDCIMQSIYCIVLYWPISCSIWLILNNGSMKCEFCNCNPLTFLGSFAFSSGTWLLFSYRISFLSSLFHDLLSTLCLVYLSFPL